MRGHTVCTPLLAPPLLHGAASAAASLLLLVAPCKWQCRAWAPPAILLSLPSSPTLGTFCPQQIRNSGRALCSTLPRCPAGLSERSRCNSLVFFIRLSLGCLLPVLVAAWCFTPSASDSTAPVLGDGEGVGSSAGPSADGGDQWRRQQQRQQQRQAAPGGHGGVGVATTGVRVEGWMARTAQAGVPRVERLLYSALGAYSYPELRAMLLVTLMAIAWGVSQLVA